PRSAPPSTRTASRASSSTFSTTRSSTGRPRATSRCGSAASPPASSSPSRIAARACRAASASASSRPSGVWRATAPAQPPAPASVWPSSMSWPGATPAAAASRIARAAARASSSCCRRWTCRREPASEGRKGAVSRAGPDVLARHRAWPQRDGGVQVTAARVLVIEDSELGVALRANLEAEGFLVDVAEDGRAGLAAVRELLPDLLILDLMLPDLDGLQILRTVRREGRGLAVLVLTARGQESDKVLALKLGADDYLTKPFGVLELLARVEALLRRSGSGSLGALGVHRAGDIELREASRTVLRDGRAVELTPKEFDLLAALVRAGGAVVS